MDDLLSDGEVSALLSDLDMDLGTAESADTASAAPRPESSSTSKAGR